MKDSFILFTEYLEQFNMLSDEQAGVLIKAIFAYSTDSELPEMDGMTKMAFSFIRSALDRSDDKYQRRVEANRENGRSGGRPRKAVQDVAEIDENSEEKPSENPNKPKKPNGFFKNPTENPTEKVKTQKPNGFFENPPDNDNERDNDIYNISLSARTCAYTREETAPLSTFIDKWGISANAIANYRGGKMAGIDWDKVSECVEHSTFLKQRKNLSFFIDHYEDILDGKYADWDDVSVTPRIRNDPDFDTSGLENIKYD